MGALAGLLWLVVSPAPRESVSWRAPSECPSAEEFRARVDELRGEELVGAQFQFFVTRSRGALELSCSGHEGRYLADSCEALVDTALLLISLALVPDEPGEAAPAEAEPLGASPSVLDLRLEAAEVAAYLRADVRPELGAGRWQPPPARLLAQLGVGAGLMPTPTAELFVGAGPRGRSLNTLWAVDLGVLGRPFAWGESSSPGLGAQLSTWGVLARGCVGAPLGRRERVLLAGCGGLELALISARPRGAEVMDARVGRRPWISAELGPELELRVSGRAAIVAGVSATFLALRPIFAIEGAGQVCCGRQLGIAGRLGVDFGLGR